MKVPADEFGDKSKWQYCDGNPQGGSASWDPPGHVPEHPYHPQGFSNLGEGSTRVVGGKLVTVYMDGERGVVMREAPLSNPGAFGPPAQIMTCSPGTGANPVPAGDHMNQSGGYGGFIQDVSPDGKTMTVLISCWDPYGVYPVKVTSA